MFLCNHRKLWCWLTTLLNARNNKVCWLYRLQRSSLHLTLSLGRPPTRSFSPTALSLCALRPVMTSFGWNCTKYRAVPAPIPSTSPDPVWDEGEDRKIANQMTYTYSLLRRSSSFSLFYRSAELNLLEPIGVTDDDCWWFTILKYVLRSRIH